MKIAPFSPPPDTILSIDIGIKNLGVCILQGTKVTYADVLNIDGGTIRETLDNLIRVVKEILKKFEIDLVLIEQQPLRHAKMLSMMHGLYGAMCMADKPARIVSPHLRVSYLGLAKETTYAQRKRASVTKVKEMFGEGLLEHCGKKLDDAADAVLQALAWKASNP